MSELIERLRRLREDRGLMADLRCFLVAGKRHRAWPALGRLGIAIDDERRAMVAALYALHPEEGGQGNLGATCRTLDREGHNGSGPTGDDKVSPTERRFLHLLAAEAGPELSDRVTRMVLMARSRGVAIDFSQLEQDLRHWNERTRREWAASFWAPGAAAAEGGRS